MLTSQVNEMKAMMTFLVQNYSGELPHDFAMFHASPVIFIKLKYILYYNWNVTYYNYFYILGIGSRKCS